MNELDVAVLIIFVFGVLGLLLGSCSPHPIVMVYVGLTYFCTRITIHIAGSYTSRKERRQ